MFQSLKGIFQSTPKLPELDESIAYTPDVARLEQFWLQNVFIYNEFMRGCHQFKPKMEGNVRKLGAAFTAENNYALWKKKLGNVSEAFALEVTEEHRLGNSSLIGYPTRILGHVYTMRPNQIMTLDKAMQNGVAFNRKRIKIRVPFNYLSDRTDPATYFGDHREEVFSVWAYIGNNSYWTSQMDPSRTRFSPVKTYNLKGDSNPYYFYAQRLEAHRG